MKKLLLNIVKYINAFANERLTADKEAEIILRYLLLKSDTKYSLEIFEALESKFKQEMVNRRIIASAECGVISKKYPFAKSVTEILVNDPIFEQPIKN